MARLSREGIVDAAFELLAAEGLDGITARALGERLGVRAGALYYHLRDMRELQDEMATRIVGKIVPDADGMPGEWRELLRAGGHRIRSTLLSYRDGAKLVSGTTLTDDTTLRRLEEPLRALVDRGFAPLDAQRAFEALNAYVTGFVIEEQHRRPTPEHPGTITAAARRDRLDPDAQPLSYALSDEVALLPEESFEWGLEALIAGIGARTGL